MSQYLQNSVCMFIKVSGKNAFTMRMFKDTDILPNCCRKSRNIWKDIRTLEKQYLNLSKETHLLSFFEPFFLVSGHIFTYKKYIF